MPVRKIDYKNMLLQKIFDTKVDLNKPDNQILNEYESIVNKMEKLKDMSFSDPEYTKLFLLAEAYYAYLVEIAPKRKKFRLKKRA